MELFFQLILLATGLVLLWKLGELAVRNALGFSSIYGVHQFTVGFIIFSISTALPEISSSIIASLNKVPELSVGDLMGSALVNLSLILGIIAVLAQKIEIFPAERKKLFKIVVLIILLLILFLVLKTGNILSGISLIILYVGSIFWFQAGLPKEEIKQEIKKIEHEIEKVEKKAFLPPKVDILIKLFGSLGLLLLASWLTVGAAIKVSKLMELDLALLGGTLIAVGTSFPELVLEIHAIKKKEYSLALGNIFGASLLNISFVLGMLMLLNPKLNLSFVWKVLPFFAVLLLWVLQMLIRKKAITRKDGYFFLAIFIGYMSWSFYSHFSIVS